MEIQHKSRFDEPVRRTNSLIEWGQEWVNVTQLDEAGAQAGLAYLYKLLGFKAPSVVFCDGWLACAQMLQREHPDHHTYMLHQDPARLPNFHFYHRDNQFADPRFSNFLSMIAQEVTEDWHRSNKLYDLETNRVITDAMHLIMQELDKASRRWQNLQSVIAKSFIATGGNPFYFNAYSADMHYLKSQWLHLDATLLAANVSHKPINMVYDWRQILRFIKSKTFVTYPLQDVVYCVRPPRHIGPTFIFQNGKEYAVPDGYQLNLNS